MAFKPQLRPQHPWADADLSGPSASIPGREELAGPQAVWHLGQTWSVKALHASWHMDLHGEG